MLEADSARARPACGPATSERFAAFRAATAELRLDTGGGLPGRVLAAQRAVWLKDFSQVLSLPRAQAAGVAGLRTPLGFPILVGSEVVGVLEFLSERSWRPTRS